MLFLVYNEFPHLEDNPDPDMLASSIMHATRSTSVEETKKIARLLFSRLTCFKTTFYSSCAAFYNETSTKFMLPQIYITYFLLRLSTWDECEKMADLILGSSD